MEKHQNILDSLASNNFPSQIDENNFPLINIFKELYEVGYVKAVDASSYDGICYMEPRITLAGREYLKKLTSPVDCTTQSISIGTLSAKNLQVGNNNNLNINISIQEIVEKVSRAADNDAKKKLGELLSNATVAGIIGSGVSALIGLL